MNIETEMIISLLKLAKHGSVSHEIINKDAKTPSPVARKLLQKLQNDGLINLRGNGVEVDDLQRLRLAVKAMESGADPERVSGFLQWKEFESVAAIAFEQSSYATKKNLRFKHDGRRWEIDVIGCRKPLIVCVDCKHWRHGLHPSTLKRIVEQQVERAKALGEALRDSTLNVECIYWNNAKLIPAILSLVTVTTKFHNDVPIVPVFQMQDFLNNLPVQADSLKHFHIELTRPS